MVAVAVHVMGTMVRALVGTEMEVVVDLLGAVVGERRGEWKQLWELLWELW